MQDDTQADVVEAPVQDTAEAQVSEANEQVSQTPEATQDEGEQSQEVKAEDTVEEKLYAGKYKSPEDLEKGYTELQSKFGQTTSEKAELTRILNEAFAEPQASTDDFAEEPSPVDQKVEKLERKTAVATFAMSHPDANGDAINKIIAEDPLINSIQGYDARLEYAYLKSQNIASSKAIVEAEKRGAQTTHKKIAEKQVAQVESTNKQSIQTDENAELKQRMYEGPIQDREAARREYIRKNLVNL